MTVRNPRIRSIYRWPGVVGLAALLALAGCKSNNSDNGTRNSDPLVSGANGLIRPQNLPLPDRGGIGANGKDPLLGGPTKPPDKSGVGYSDDPSRFKTPYIPGPNSMPAALAGNLKTSDELKIDGNENRVPLQQTGAVLPAKPTEQGTALDALYREFEKYGCKREDRSLGQENGAYVFRASVPRDGKNGAKLQVAGTGQTQEEAVKQALDQVIEDRK
ncbi:MAG TPA: hypothetical protein VG122_17165 [Gemmata sp.]|jgi:hypothetical protein|nr:hypothetical protein [Gemmata sp.]